MTTEKKNSACRRRAELMRRRGIVTELRARQWIKGEKGLFAGSVSSGGGGGKGEGGGKKGLTTDGENGILQSSSMPEWSDKEAAEPFNYWELSEDKTGFPARWKPTGFSHDTTLQKHFKEHGQSVGAKDAADYQSKAIAFLGSPRGKHGDAFVRKSGDVCRFDYDSGLFAIATKSGVVKTFWNLNADRENKGAAAYWSKEKSIK